MSKDEDRRTQDSPPGPKPEPKTELRARFDLVPGASAPPELETLRSAFEFARSTRSKVDDPILQFGIFNMHGELALFCVLRGFLQASEFSSLIGKAGYLRRSNSVAACDFIFYPGHVIETQTTTRNTLS